MIIELHLLQSFPVSNLNRDDVGQPKMATFGGHARGRISSQSLKRAARQLFDQYGLDTTEVGVRTKRLVNEATEILIGAGRDTDTARPAVTAALHRLGFGVDDTKGLTQYLLFVSREAVDELARYCEDNWTTLTAAKKSAKVKVDKGELAALRRILDGSRTADIALFGRMIADNKEFNVDAASQVAHAISTHVVATEFDYFTAVDDLKPDDEAGADMIGTVDFNAACYYRYANVDLTQLTKNLQGDKDLAARTVRAWLQAFIHAVPGGKQNSMAARTMPDTLFAVVREDGAWNLANAFLKPVTGEDMMTASTEKLLGHYGKLAGFYGTGQIRGAVAASATGEVPATDGVEVARSMDEFVDSVATTSGV